MAYVEFLRARRTLLWYFGILLGFYVLQLIAGLFGAQHVGIVIDTSDAPTPHATPPPELGSTWHAPLPISLLEYIATYGAILVGAILGSSLNRQRDNLPLAWTRPLGRERFVLGVLAVDALAILTALLGTLAYAKLATVTHSGHVPLYIDSQAFPTFLFGLGAALMAYALAQALTSWLAIGGGVIKGVAFAACAALVGLGTARLPSPYGSIVWGLNYLNPFAYFVPIYIDDKHGPIVLEFLRFIPFDVGMKIACVWLLAAAYMAIATYGWKRLEI